ncbi:MAG: FtsX-like permease family protein, partial [Sporomusaceae bacterium]|nr:FtsX-like permease family protein [Sporomusaceae bacterium]
SFQIKVEDKFEPFIITGVAENPPSNSSFQFSMLSSFSYFANTAFGKLSLNRWVDQFPFLTYVQLTAGSKLPFDNKLLSDFRKKYFPNEDQTPSTYKLEPLVDIHTNIRFLFNKIPPIDPLSIWILLSIAGGILLIACINFTTLALGRSANRSKEVGVRKVIGGTRKTIVVQFFIESMVLTVLATAIGLILARLLLPFFNNLSGRTLHFSFTQFPQLSYIILAVILIVGVLSGSYPSLMLSRFKPAHVLKTKVRLGGANFFTESLVTLQFAISAGLVISAVIIIQQLHYMQSKHPGFNKENVVVVNAMEISGSKNIYHLFKQSLALHPQITGIASAENGLGEGGGTNIAGYDHNGKSLSIHQYYVDNDYIPVLDMQILTGRNFIESIAKDTVTSVIINEALMNALGFSPQNAVGQVLKGYGPAKDAPIVIGVVKNFNFQSISKPVEPQMFHQFGGSQPYRFFVRIKPGNPSPAIAGIQKAWTKAAFGYPLQFSFLDEDLDRFNKSEVRLSYIVGWAGSISIFLACLGLLGLAALAVLNRTKEIGIRKVLGATLTTILALISKDFLRLVVLAFLIATP